MIILDKSGGFVSYEPTYDQGGVVKLLALGDAHYTAGSLVKVVYSPRGFRLAPLNSPANRYHVGYLRRASVVRETQWVQIGGVVGPLRIGADLHAGDFLSVVDGQIVARTDGPPYALSAEFGAVVQAFAEDQYQIALMPILVVTP